jgi:hypothetical protein
VLLLVAGGCCRLLLLLLLGAWPAQERSPPCSTRGTQSRRFIRGALPANPTSQHPADPASAWSHRLRGARPLTVAAAVATTRARRVREQLWVCIPITALYLVLIFGGQAYMRDRPAWDVRRALICWNWLCSIFSLIGALRVVPHALSVPLPLPPRKWSTVLPPSRVIPASKVVDH